MMIGHPRRRAAAAGMSREAKADSNLSGQRKVSCDFLLKALAQPDEVRPVTHFGKAHEKAARDLPVLSEEKEGLDRRVSTVNVRQMTGHLTPKQAARRAGVGRTTIMRALERDELKALRDNSGHWQIASEALEDWMSMRPDRSHARQSQQTVTDSNHGQELAAAKVKLATLTAQKEGLEARLSDAHAERDRLAAALDKALEPRNRLIARIFGRS